MITGGQLSFSDTHNGKPMLSKIGCLSSISDSIGMPVFAINLKSNPMPWQIEVNRITSKPGFLGILETEIVQSQSNIPLKQCFCFRTTVTSKGTESPITIPREAPKLFATGLAIDNPGRAAALFRTIMAIKALLCGEWFTTSITVLVFRLCQSARAAANRISVGNAGKYGKWIAALGTNLRHRFTGGSTNSLTDTGTKAPSMRLAVYYIELFAADWTRSVLTCSRTALGHCAPSMHRIQTLYHRWYAMANERPR